MDADQWITLGLSGLLGSGGVVAFMRARSETPKINAETQSIIIADLTAENTRLKTEITSMHSQLADALRQIEHLRERVLLLESGR